jgi:hypothetical protein
MSQPDMIAWMQFIEAARPAAPGNTNAVFEGWASDQDTFTPQPRWPDAARAGGKILINKLGKTGPATADRGRWAIAPALTCAPGKIAPCIGKETLRNRPAFDFIVENKLYTQRGLAAAFAGTVSFPTGTIEVKAEWLPVAQLQGWNGVTPEQAASLYHISTARIEGQSVPVALIALHVISKELPNWTWATFEHWKNPGRCDVIGCHEEFGTVNADETSNPRPDQGYAYCEHSTALKRMVRDASLDDVWLNYCLKGTQTNFITSAGNATLLGNSISETINAGVPPPRSSCITCHAEAAADRNGKAALIRFETGSPQPSWFMGSGSPSAPQYKQADFVWAVPLCALAADGVTPCTLQPSGK